MMEYVGVIVVFLATIIGITGDTYDTNAKGAKRITIQGWMIILFAIIGLEFHSLPLQERKTTKQR